MKRTLYKYCSVSSPENVRRFKRLLEGNIYFSSPLRFNDPFELSAKIDISRSPLMYGLSRRQAGEVNRLFRLANPDAVSNDWKGKIGILCLSEYPLSILMWSHYAFDHSGICVGFDTGYPPFHDAIKVLYSPDRPCVTIGSSSDELLENVFLKKSIHWEYEGEWRVIRRTIEEDERDFYFERYQNGEACLDEISELISSNGGPGVYDFPVAAIRSVFLGARMSPDVRAEIVRLVRSTGVAIKIFDVELDGRYFCLNKKKVY
ncbi:DUF2971 domain-containing protein [Pseudomonas sp. SCB32]|uniref:DUF2971 domain-containing protein n=1 Tax=Pseudomonas sp. SCB32 TaxID=2653853 RepID=UPI0015B462DC|nr:DUF2971 domain-containing protein [Pseudomonas sp. SCB32]